MPNSGPDMDEVLQLMIEVAEEVIRPRWRSLERGDVSEKGPGDVVTIADRDSEVRLTAALTQAFPGALVVGEEAVSANPALLVDSHLADHVFYVDPVDGTRQFIQGSPDYAVMIGEIRAGEITRSWILQPEHGRSYLAELGSGARAADGERLWCAEPGPNDLHGATSVPEIIHDKDLSGHINRHGICCGVDYPDLVLGLQDFLLYQTPKPWDHVPGTLLVTEAGGAVGTFDQRAYVGQPVSTALLSAPTSAAWHAAEHLLGPGRRGVDEISATIE